MILQPSRESLYAGKCGIGPITKFDPSEYKCRVAAEVKDFDITNYGMEKGDGRRMDIYCQYAMAAAWQAVNQSGIIGAVEPERWAYTWAAVSADFIPRLPRRKR